MLTRRPRLQLGCVFGSGLHLIASCASGSRSARSSSSALKFKRKRRAFCFVVRHRDNIPHWRTKVFTPGRPTLGTGWSVLSLPCGARRPSESAPLDANAIAASTTTRFSYFVIVRQKHGHGGAAFARAPLSLVSLSTHGRCTPFDLKPLAEKQKD